MNKMLVRLNKNHFPRKKGTPRAQIEYAKHKLNALRTA